LFVNQGNLVIGTDTPGETVKFVAGGTTSNDIIVVISNTGISTPGNVTANYFVGNGSQLTGIVAGNITGQVANALVAGTVYINAQPNITSVGTLTTLTVSGNITSGNANLGNVATANFFVGNGYGLTNINVSNITGTIANANYAAYAGNVINSLTINNSGTGAASGATFNGGNPITISYNTVGAPKADGTGASGIWGISITGNSNVANTANAVAGANVSGQVSFAATANAVAGANVSGQVSFAATANSVAGSNVSGQVSFAATANSVAGANVSGQVANSLVARTVYANSQPNITSVGTLTTLTVSGDLNTGRVIATGNITGTQLISNAAPGTAPLVVSSTTAVANLRAAAANTADTVTTNAQPNITSVGTLTSITVSGTSNLGAVGNVTITGGSANYVLQTNGSGGLSWVAQQGNGAITTVTPNALSSTVHIAAVTTGNTVNIITDATTANTANTIVVRDVNGAINVSGWTVGTHLTAVDYTATNNDYWIGTTAKNRTITLPNAANGATNGRQYQIADTVHSGNPNTTINAQSPDIVSGNQPSQQGQMITATYISGVWYLN
jgi:hypothetical protein